MDMNGRSKEIAQENCGNSTQVRQIHGQVRDLVLTNTGTMNRDRDLHTPYLPLTIPEVQPMDITTTSGPKTPDLLKENATYILPTTGIAQEAQYTWASTADAVLHDNMSTTEDDQEIAHIMHPQHTDSTIGHSAHNVCGARQEENATAHTIYTKAQVLPPTNSLIEQWHWASADNNHIWSQQPPVAFCNLQYSGSSTRTYPYTDQGYYTLGNNTYVPPARNLTSTMQEPLSFSAWSATTATAHEPVPMTQPASLTQTTASLNESALNQQSNTLVPYSRQFTPIGHHMRREAQTYQHSEQDSTNTTQTTLSQTKPYKDTGARPKIKAQPRMGAMTNPAPTIVPPQSKKTEANLAVLATLLLIPKNGRIHCWRCNEDFPAYTDEHEHIRSRHAAMLSCSEITPEIRTLIIESVTQERQRQASNSTTLQFVCDKCPYKGPSQFDLLIHGSSEHTRMGERNGHCPLCNQLLNQSLVVHYHMSHSERCCNLELITFNDYIIHNFYFHLAETIRQLSPLTIVKLVSYSLDSGKFLPWVNTFPRIPTNFCINPKIHREERNLAENTENHETHVMVQYGAKYSEFGLMSQALKQGRGQTLYTDDINEKIVLTEELISSASQFNSELKLTPQLPEKIIPSAHLPPNSCSLCQDDTNHADTQDRCFNRSANVSELIDLMADRLTEDRLKTVELVMIGAQVYKTTPPCLGKKVLNLSLADYVEARYPTGHHRGNQVILPTTPGLLLPPYMGVGAAEPNNYFEILQQIFHKLPKDLSCPILVEFYMQGSQDATENTTATQVLSFIYEILSLRKIKEANSLTKNLILLGTVPIVGVNESQEKTNTIYSSVEFANRILLIEGLKHRIPVYAPDGDIQNAWRKRAHRHQVIFTLHPYEQQELLFNKNRSTTREALERIGRLFERIMHAYAKARGRSEAIRYYQRSKERNA